MELEKEGIVSGLVLPTAGWVKKYETLGVTSKMIKDNVSSIQKPPEVELKKFPSHFQYAYLDLGQKFPVIISTYLTEEHMCRLLALLRKHKRVIACHVFVIKETSPTIFMHRILMEDNSNNNI